MLPEHPVLTGMFKSVESWFNAGMQPSEALMEAKIKEVILTLVEIMPELKSVHPKLIYTSLPMVMFLPNSHVKFGSIHTRSPIFLKSLRMMS